MRLTVVAGPDRGRSASVAEGPFLIGTDDRCDLVLRDSSVAPTHASLEVSPAGTATLRLLVEDGAALHVNGERVEAPVVLQGGEVLQIGGTMIWTSFREPQATTGSRQGTVVGERQASFWIVICSGRDSGTWHEVSGDRFVVGRGSDCDLTLPDDRVSRQHASFRMSSRGRIFLKDLGSSNGTIVNGRRIRAPVGFAAQGEVELSGSDLVQFGDSLVWVTRDQPSRAD